MENKIRILQTNIRSLKSNANLLQIFIQTYNIDIVILNETWTQTGKEPKIPGYKLIVKNRNDGYGGVGVLIKNKIGAKQINMNINLTDIETMQIKIKYGNNNLNIIVFYNPSNSNSTEKKDEFQKILKLAEHNKNTIVAGDINAYNKLWGNNNKEDKMGKEIAEVIEKSSIQILNNGEPTRQDLRHNTTSAIDITLCTPDIYNKIKWETVTNNIGSDHIPILMNMNIEKYNKRETVNWKKVIQNITNEEYNTDTNNNIEERLEKAIQENTRIITSNSKTKPKHWWNEKIKRLWDIKEGKQKCYNKQKNLYKATELLRAIAKLKKRNKNSKKRIMADICQ